MGHERWFRGQHDGQGRPFDWLTTARQHGIPDKLARVLYEQAMQQAHGATQDRVQELYLALLASARRDAVRPSPGKVTRTMRLQAHQAGKRRRPYISRLTGQPISPGKRTLTSYLESAVHEGHAPNKEQERLETNAVTYQAVSAAISADLQGAMAPTRSHGDQVQLGKAQAIPSGVTRPSTQDIMVPGTVAYRQFQASLAAAFGHFEELEAPKEEGIGRSPMTFMEASPTDTDGEDFIDAEVSGWSLPPTSPWTVQLDDSWTETSPKHARLPAWGEPSQVQLADKEEGLLPLMAIPGRQVESWGAAGPIQAAGLQETPEVPVPLPGHGGGAEMPEDVRAKMEAAFGMDFSSVRIHVGTHVEAIGALAYTQGADIHFAPGQYQPQSPRGQELLGHELTHVVQQSQGRVQTTTQARGVDINDDASLEREADEMGARAARGAESRIHTGFESETVATQRRIRASEAGRDLHRVLAYEPAHVVQQASGAFPLIQRQVAACRPRPRGEADQSRTAQGILPVNVVYSASDSKLRIQDFPVNSTQIPPNVTNSLDWQRVMSTIAGDPSMRLSVTGYTDCVGTRPENLSLRRARVDAVMALLPPTVRARVLFNFTAATTTYVDTNETPEGRARNRSVEIHFLSVPPSGQQACDMLARASNLDEYIFLVRCAETRLGRTSTGDAPTVISVLRQIYYGGATWSQSQNPVWNMVIPDRPWAPATHPEPILGPRLYAALRRSQVVEGHDMGHLLTGIDAMLNPQQVTLQAGRLGFDTGVPNEEWATWAGDVGSAAAEWTVEAIYSGALPHHDEFFRNFAGPSDLLGDIDSFALRMGQNVGIAPSAQLMRRLSPGARLSELLLEYFRQSGTSLGRAQSRRIPDFIAAYGGSISGTTIANRAALATRFRDPVSTFAGLFMTNSLVRRGALDSSRPAPPWLGRASALLDTAINEMVGRFIDWLEQNL